MKKTVFIDGQHGTTGLKIHERLNARTDIELISIPEESRKDLMTKERLLNEADIVFICLPDNAARESVSLIKNKAVCVIDGSTAHRVAEGWVYGKRFPGKLYLLVGRRGAAGPVQDGLCLCPYVQDSLRLGRGFFSPVIFLLFFGLPLIYYLLALLEDAFYGFVPGRQDQ